MPNRHSFFLSCTVTTLLVAIALNLSAACAEAARRRAVVRVATAKLRSAPSEDKKTLALLDRGDAMSVVGRRSGWIKVETESGKTGWVRADLIRMRTVREQDSPAKVAVARKRSSRSDAPISPQASARTVATGRRKASVKRAGEANVARTAKSARNRTNLAEAIRSPKPTKTTAGPAESSQRPPKTVAKTEKRGSEIAKVVDAAELETSETSSPNDTVPPSVSMEPAEVLPVAPEPEVAIETPVDRIGRARASLVEDALSVYRAENEPNRSSTYRSALVSRAKSLRGTPYRFGATGRGSFDCSGFTQHLYRRQGVGIPRTAAEQFHSGTPIGRMSLRQGDLVFFRNTGGRRGISHVGLFLGSGRFIHASSRGGGVRIDSLTEDFYASHYAGARRMLR